MKSDKEQREERKITRNLQREDFLQKQWIYTGISWGMFMFIITTITDIFRHTITWKSALISLPIYLLGGLAFGYVMKKYFERHQAKKEQ